MREKRDESFNKRRFGSEGESENVQDTLMNMVREEFRNLITLGSDDEHLKLTEADEPMSLEAAMELENEIVGEQGTMYHFCHNLLFTITYHFLACDKN